MNLGVICVVSKLYKREKHWFFLASRGSKRAEKHCFFWWVGGGVQGGQGGQGLGPGVVGGRVRGPRHQTYGAFL